MYDRVLRHLNEQPYLKKKCNGGRTCFQPETIRNFCVNAETSVVELFLSGEVKSYPAGVTRYSVHCLSTEEENREEVPLCFFFFLRVQKKRHRRSSTLTSLRFFLLQGSQRSRIPSLCGYKP